MGVRSFLVGTVLVLGVVPAMGQDVPTEADARALIEEAIANQAEGRIQLRSFAKTDGIPREFAGQRFYELEFQLTVEFMDNAKWLVEGLGSSAYSSFATLPGPPARMTEMDKLWRNMQAGREHQRGDLVDLVGSIGFERTESRWRHDGGPFRLQEISTAQANDPSSTLPSDPSGPRNKPLEPSPDWNRIVEGGSAGSFLHGSKVKACYSGGQMVAIELRDTQWNVRCEAVRNLVHAGVDIAAPIGTEVHPLAAGTIEAVIGDQTTPGHEWAGYAVIIRHDEKVGERDTFSLYLHFQNPPPFGVGDHVDPSSVIGQVGETGAAFGPHVHIEVRHFDGWLHKDWGNIYGVEGSSAAGGTFDAGVFASDWEDPALLLRGFTAAALSESPSSGEVLGASSRDARWDQATREYQAGRLTEFAQLISAMAEDGDVMAQGWLGSLFLSGTGFAKNETKALEWFRRAADAGEPGAQYNLGDMYLQGVGVQEDPTEAERWYSLAFEGYLQAAEAGDPNAQYRVGFMLEFGAGVTKDLGASASWFEKGSAQSHPASQRELGMFYLQGKGVAQDRTKAENLLILAARAGDVTAQEQLTKMKIRW